MALGVSHICLYLSSIVPEWLFCRIQEPIMADVDEDLKRQTITTGRLGDLVIMTSCVTCPCLFWTAVRLPPDSSAAVRVQIFVPTRAHLHSSSPGRVFIASLFVSFSVLKRTSFLYSRQDGVASNVSLIVWEYLFRLRPGHTGHDGRASK